MNILPVEIQRKIALKLPLLDLINFCSIEKIKKEKIWDSHEFWYLRLQQDFPHIWEYYVRIKLQPKNPKNIYKREITENSAIFKEHAKCFLHLHDRNNYYHIMWEIYFEKSKISSSLPEEYDDECYKIEQKYPNLFSIVCCGACYMNFLSVSSKLRRYKV